MAAAIFVSSPVQRKKIPLMDVFGFKEQEWKEMISFLQEDEKNRLLFVGPAATGKSTVRSALLKLLPKVHHSRIGMDNNYVRNPMAFGSDPKCDHVVSYTTVNGNKVRVIPFEQRVCSRSSSSRSPTSSDRIVDALVSELKPFL